MDFIFALVVMVSAILASPSDRVRGRKEERKRETKEKLLLSHHLGPPDLVMFWVYAEATGALAFDTSPH